MQSTANNGAPTINRPGFLIALFLILVILIFGFAWLEYRANRTQLLHVMSEEAYSLAEVAARAAENGLEAYAQWETEIVRRMRITASLADQLEISGKLDSGELVRLAEETEIHRIRLLAANGDVDLDNHPRGMPDGAPEMLESVIPEFLASGETERILGFRSGRLPGENRFAMIARRGTGGVILLNLDAKTLLDFRRRIGAEALVREIDKIPGLSFAVLEDSTGVVAISRRAWDIPFPREDAFIDNCLANGLTDSRMVTIHNDDGGTVEILEAVSPLRIPGGGPGVIRIGLATDHLRETVSTFRRNLLLRAGLILVLALALIGFLATSASRRMLAGEYARISKEVKRLEAERAIEERLTAMGELARGVAHEIRNPLNAMRMVAQRLSREFTPRDDAEGYRELTGTMVGEVDRVAGIVDEFLRFARPARASLLRGDFNQLVQESVSAFRAQAEAHSVAIDWRPAPLPEFPFDAGLMKQVLLNLMINALEALEPGGTIALSSARLGDRAVLEIGDDGSGMDEATLSRIWDLYYTTKETGTGMGLPTVYRIVQEHGGSIAVESHPGRGTKFTIELAMERT